MRVRSRAEPSARDRNISDRRRKEERTSRDATNLPRTQRHTPSCSASLRPRAQNPCFGERTRGPDRSGSTPDQAERRSRPRRWEARAGRTGLDIKVNQLSFYVMRSSGLRLTIRVLDSAADLCLLLAKLLPLAFGLPDHQGRVDLLLLLLVWTLPSRDLRLRHSKLVS